MISELDRRGSPVQDPTLPYLPKSKKLTSRPKTGLLLSRVLRACLFEMKGMYRRTLTRRIHPLAELRITSLRMAARILGLIEQERGL